MGIITKIIKQIYKYKKLDLVVRAFRSPKNINSSEIILPNCDYAPWNLDTQFLECYEHAKKYTLIDLYRCWELWEIVGEVVRTVPGDIIEVGVWRGGSAGIITKRLSLLNTNRKVYLADTFEGVVKASKEDSTYFGGEHSDTSVEIVEELLSQTLKVTNYEILKGIFPDETCSIIENQKLAMVHIDVDVYQSAKDVLEWAWPRLSIGGIIVFDDFGWTNCDGIIKLIDEKRMSKDNLIFHNLNGHALMVKLH